MEVPAAVTPSAAQLEAIGHNTGPLEVLAGHGTGKTFVLTHRHARLIAERIAWKYDVLSLTFTRQAAHEMAQRIQLLLDEDIDSLPVRTIHAHARIVLLNAAESRNQKPFRVLDEGRAYRVLVRAMATEQVSREAWPAATIAAEIEAAKERGIGPEAFRDVPDSAAQQTVARVYTRYQALLRQANAYDFADLIMAAVELLQCDEELRAQLHLQHRFLQVDEWQDVNTAQYRFIRLLTGPDENLFVVGSEAQAIYGWRRANYKKLAQRFQQDFSAARRMVLTENWRSTAPIILAARSLFNGDYRDVDLVSMRGPGLPIQRVAVDNELEEAAFVALEAQRLVPSVCGWGDIGVLYRSAAQAPALEQELMHRGLPYRLAQGRSLYERRAARHMLAYLEYAVSGSDRALAQIVNVPHRGLGPATIRRLKGDETTFTLNHLLNAVMDPELGLRDDVRAAAETLADFLFELRARAADTPPAELIAHVVVGSGYEAWLAGELDQERRLRTIRDLQTDAGRYATAQAFLDGVRQQVGRQNEFADEDAITLSTIHNAKGRQWTAVFMLGMEEGLLPHRRAAGRSGQPDSPEERRLAHVAWSRAKDRLYLIVAATRGQDGQYHETRPSRYLMCIPPEIVTRR